MRVPGHLLLLTLATAPAGAQSRPAPASVPPSAVSFSGPAMGGRYGVRVVMPPGDEAANERIRSAIARELALADRLFSAESASSELARLNAHAGAGPLVVSPETFQALELARRASEWSGGAFGVDYRLLQLDRKRSSVTKARPDVACDVSALARGWAADRIAGALRALGHRNVLVDVAGRVAARGRRADGGRWRVAVEWPDGARDRVLLVELEDAAAATSGDSRKALDPRTGRPITHDLASVTVVDRDGAWADALATALLVLGPQEGRALAARERVAARFVQRQPDGSFAEWSTPGFEAFVPRAP